MRQYCRCGSNSVLYNSIFMLWGKICLSLFNMPIVLKHLPAIMSACVFHLR